MQQANAWERYVSLQDNTKPASYTSSSAAGWWNNGPRQELSALCITILPNCAYKCNVMRQWRVWLHQAISKCILLQLGLIVSYDFLASPPTLFPNYNILDIITYTTSSGETLHLCFKGAFQSMQLPSSGFKAFKTYKLHWCTHLQQTFVIYDCWRPYC